MNIPEYDVGNWPSTVDSLVLSVTDGMFVIKVPVDNVKDLTELTIGDCLVFAATQLSKEA